MGKGCAEEVRGPVTWGEGDELRLFRGDPEAVSGKPARHMLEALCGQGSSVSTRATGGDDGAIVNIHVDIASDSLLHGEEEGCRVNGREDRGDGGPLGDAMGEGNGVGEEVVDLDADLSV